MDPVQGSRISIRSRGKCWALRDATIAFCAIAISAIWQSMMSAWSREPVLLAFTSDAYRAAVASKGKTRASPNWAKTPFHAFDRRAFGSALSKRSIPKLTSYRTGAHNMSWGCKGRKILMTLGSGRGRINSDTTLVSRMIGFTVATDPTDLRHRHTSHRRLALYGSGQSVKNGCRPNCDRITSNPSPSRPQPPPHWRSHLETVLDQRAWARVGRSAGPAVALRIPGSSSPLLRISKLHSYRTKKMTTSSPSLA